MQLPPGLTVFLLGTGHQVMKGIVIVGGWLIALSENTRLLLHDGRLDKHVSKSVDSLRYRAASNHCLIGVRTTGGSDPKWKMSVSHSQESNLESNTSTCLSMRGRREKWQAKSCPWNQLQVVLLQLQLAIILKPERKSRPNLSRVWVNLSNAKGGL